MEVTKEQVTAAFKVCVAIGEAIRDLGSVPEGELYVNVMGYMSIDAFNGAIGQLVAAGLLRRDCNVLVWCGPTKKP